MTDQVQPAEELESADSNSPQGLRATIEAKDARIAKLEERLSKKAFADAGFPKGTKERQALERFFDGDRTDSDAIRTFAVDVMGYTPGEGASSDPDDGGTNEPVAPAPTVVADARADQLESGAIPIVHENPEDEATQKRDAALKRAVEEGGDPALITESISQELARTGVLEE